MNARSIGYWAALGLSVLWFLFGPVFKVHASEGSIFLALLALALK